MLKKVLLYLLVMVCFTSLHVLNAFSADKIVKIDGSSTVYPITEAVSEEFQKAKKGAIKVTVGISGTGGGFKKFCRGEIDINNASRPISKKEIEACNEGKIEYIELPIAYDGLAVVVNPQNTWATSLTIADLKKMWEPAAAGTIKKWNQVRPEWPDAPLKLFGPGADSGTFDYFTEAVVGKAKSSRADFTASEDDNVLVQGVARDKFALGYFGLAYYEENKDKIKVVAIDSGKGPVIPSEKTIMDGTYTPLSRPLLLYVNKEAATKKPEVKEFVDFYLKNAAKLTKEARYIPLPKTAYQLAQDRFAKLKTGTMFGKETVGLRIEDLMKMEEKSK